MGTQTILGIDPGYDRIGWCILEQEGSTQKICASGCIETNRQTEILSRFQEMQDALEDIVATYHPSACALENLFFEKNVKTAMRVSEARGIIIGVLLRHRVSIAEYTPLQIKSALTGNGSATKADIARMVALLTKDPKRKRLDDELDAIAAAMCHRYSHVMKAYA